MSLPRRRATVLTVLLVLVAIAVACVVAQPPRDALARVALAAYLTSKGFHLAHVDLTIDGGELRAANLSITENDGGPFASADLIDVRYGVRGRLLGISSVVVRDPDLTIHRARDGSYDIARFFGNGSSSGGGAPVILRASIAHGTIVLVNAFSPSPSGRRFVIGGIDADATIHQGAVSSGWLRAAVAGAPAPVTAHFLEDDRSRFARAQIDARGVPIGPAVNLLVSNTAFVIDGGTADARVTAYAVDWPVASGPAWHLGGDGVVRDAIVRVIPLAAPVEGVNGAFSIADTTVIFPALRANAATLPVRSSGTLTLLPSPMVDLALAARGPLQRARGLLAFTKPMPLHGPIDLVATIRGPAASPHAIVAVRSAGAVRYGAVTLDAVRARTDYALGHVVIRDAFARYDGIAVYGDGDVDLQSSSPSGQFAAIVDAPSTNLPWIASAESSGATRAVAALSGPLAHIEGAGFAAVSGGRVPLAAALQVDSDGMRGVAIGDDREGGDLFAGVELGRSGARPLWADLIARDFALRIDNRSVFLPGVSKQPIALPRTSARLQGRIALRGTVDAPAAAVLFAASRLRVGAAQLGRLSVDAAGAGGRLALRDATLAGPRERITATGSIALASHDGFGGALHGDADGDLRSIASVTASLGASLPATGRIHSTYSLAFWPHGWFGAAQLTGAGASVAGVSVADASALVGGDGRRIVIYGGHAGIAGGQLLAQGSLPGASLGSLLVVARDLDARQLSAGRAPVTAGTVDAIASIHGTAANPRVDGAAILEHGLIDGASIAGDTSVRYAGGLLQVDGGRIVSSDSQIDVDGSVTHLFGGDPTLALDASMPVGDLATLSALARSPLPLTGVASATGAVVGPLSMPHVSGIVSVGSGTVRGVVFNDLSASLAAAPGYVGVQQAHVRFGSSSLEAAGSLSRGIASLHASSTHVDLDDFNDFFDGKDVLEGIGAFDVAVDATPRWQQARGSAHFADVDFATLPLGSVRASMQPTGDATEAHITQSGPLAQTDVWATVRAANGEEPALNAVGSIRSVDLAGTAERMGFQQIDVGGVGHADFRIYGPMDRLIGQSTFGVDAPHISGIDLRSLSGSVAASADGIILQRVDASASGGSLHASGRIDRRGRIDAGSTVRVDDLAALGQTLRVPYAMAGSGTIAASATGTIARPRVKLALQAEHGDVDEIAFDSVTGGAAYAANRLTASAALSLAKAGGSVRLSAALPVRLRPFAIGPNDMPLRVDLATSQANIAVANPFLHGNVVLAGTLDAQTHIAGTVGRPTLSGVGHVRNATVRSRYDSVPLSGLSADVAFANDSVTLSGVHASVGRGSLDVKGEAHVVPAVGLRKTASLQYAFDSALHDADIDVPDLIKGVVTADLSLTKSGTIPYLSGGLALTNTTVPFAGVLALANSAGGMGGPKSAVVPGLPQLQPGHTIVYGGSLFGDDLEHVVQPTPKPTPPSAAAAALAVLPPKLNLGLQVDADKNVSVTGLINVSGTGRVKIDGDTNKPRLDGTLTAIRGNAGFLNTKFDLEDGWLTFSPRDGFLPTVAADATTSTDEADITVSVSGRVDNLHTVFDSNPEMSQAAIVASLLHVPQINSALASSHGEQQAALGVSPENLASGVLAGEIFGALNSGLEQVFNLEEVDFGIDPYGNPSLEVRKQVSPRAYTLYRTTFTVPSSQAYGIAYSLRRALQIELTQTQGLQGPANPLGYPEITQIQIKVSFH
jgi:autotransporter translocation and assembly factor TamB